MQLLFHLKVLSNLRKKKSESMKYNFVEDRTVTVYTLYT